MMEKEAKIYVAGHKGMAGSAIVRKLKRQGYGNIITRTHQELDLTREVIWCFIQTRNRKDGIHETGGCGSVL